jgi:hypothetical protein
VPLEAAFMDTPNATNVVVDTNSFTLSPDLAKNDMVLFRYFRRLLEEIASEEHPKQFNKRATAGKLLFP